MIESTTRARYHLRHICYRFHEPDAGIVGIAKERSISLAIIRRSLTDGSCRALRADMLCLLDDCHNADTGFMLLIQYH